MTEIVQRASPDLALWLETELQTWLAPLQLTGEVIRHLNDVKDSLKEY